MNFAKTAYLEQKLLNHVFSGESYTPPTQLYLALFTGDPGRLGEVAEEIADSAYERQAVIFTAAADDETSGSNVKNVYDIEYPQATEDWGTVSHAMVTDAQTGGNGLYYVALDTAKEITVDDFIKFPAGSFVVVED